MNKLIEKMEELYGGTRDCYQRESERLTKENEELKKDIFCPMCSMLSEKLQKPVSVEDMEKVIDKWDSGSTKELAQAIHKLINKGGEHDNR